MKILVVDDERAVRESLRRALELEGYEIELAADGGEALYRLEAPDEEPDAMILDVLMSRSVGAPPWASVRECHSTAAMTRSRAQGTPPELLTALRRLEGA